jgi:ubiquinone/menaquinone biosynthesis C-methylase UbiE
MEMRTRVEELSAEVWNGVAGRAWVEAQSVLDEMFRPIEELLVAPLSPADRVLDVGCGTGGVTVAAARRVGPTGTCLGIDVSEPMIAGALARAKRNEVTARFITADAQRHEFGSGRFDVILSRFGVMFFDDPVAAFANLSSAVRRGGTLRFVAWRSAEENVFMTTAERAAAPVLPGLPSRRTGEPGQFGFAERSHVERILNASGWEELAVRPLDVTCRFSESDLSTYVARLGPVGRALEGADEQTRAAVVETVRAAFAPFVHGTEVQFTACCWMVTARAPQN